MSGSQSPPNPVTADRSAWQEAFSRSKSNCFPNSAVEQSQSRLRVQLAKTLDFHWGPPLSPIRTLPPEITSEIFELVTLGRTWFWETCGRLHLSIDVGFFLVARNHRLPALVLVLLGIGVCNKNSLHYTHTGGVSHTLWDCTYMSPNPFSPCQI
ncbi:hypothetical protein BT96DRAFT_928248 [Gymnopus androsaceus JB14]|uniref:Uncharacterized protein n=1 Tax=Gymnopus androsaceus JB14 TaxID=1447944 RepID=A0A6A4GM33_9AGAR|nr:hypothetical protein BT96DRAFT_928248 [Gymnopus androsaceus JB14]